MREDKEEEKGWKYYTNSRIEHTRKGKDKAENMDKKDARMGVSTDGTLLLMMFNAYSVCEQT